MRVDILSKLPKVIQKNLDTTTFCYSDGLELDYDKVYIEDGVFYCKDTNEAYKKNVQDSNVFNTNLISSKFGDSLHRVILDLDFECELLPSSSPGRYHLYTDKVISETDMDRLVNVLTEVGILNEGIKTLQWDTHKELTLRLPWVKKGEDKSFMQQNV